MASVAKIILQNNRNLIKCILLVHYIHATLPYPCPYLKINILGEDLLALVDCGSCSSSLGSSGYSLLRKWDLPVSYNIDMRITTADDALQD